MATSTRARSKRRALARLDVGHAGLDALLEPLVGQGDQPRVGEHHLTAARDVLAGLRALGEDREHDRGEVVDQVAVRSAGAEGLEQLGAEHGRSAEDGVVLAGEVVEEGAPGDPRLLGELLHREAVETVLEGELLRAGGDPVCGQQALVGASMPRLAALIALCVIECSFALLRIKVQIEAWSVSVRTRCQGAVLLGATLQHGPFAVVAGARSPPR